jgi:hypothetical protein
MWPMSISSDTSPQLWARGLVRAEQGGARTCLNASAMLACCFWRAAAGLNWVRLDFRNASLVPRLWGPLGACGRRKDELRRVTPNSVPLVELAWLGSTHSLNDGAGRAASLRSAARLWGPLGACGRGKHETR